MPKYKVLLELTKTSQREMSVYAKTPEEAMQKAEGFASDWPDVDEANAIDAWDEDE